MAPIFRHGCLRSAALCGSTRELHGGPILDTSSPRVTPRFLRTHDAAAFLGLSGRTLEKHRCTGTGPVFRKLGGRVVYAIDDLESWAAERARSSTSDPGKQPSSGSALSARPGPSRGR